MDGNKLCLSNDANLEAFLSELTDLSVRHGILIAGKPVLVFMERDDYPYSYDADDEGNLIRRYL
jgi:hypothetical protein